MKKTAKALYVVLFLIVCCAPLVMVIFFPSDRLIGNEKKASQPQLISSGGINRDFSNEFDKWFTQSIPFRAELINVRNTVLSGSLGKSANNVIVGKDGWLFTEECTDDYLGHTVSEREIHNIAATLRLVQKHCRMNGAEFVFAAAPDKCTIYPEYMPSGYIKGKTTNLDLLEKELEKQGVSYADLRGVMLGHKADGEELYLKTDTHWNNLAALYAFNEIEDKLSHKHKNYGGASFEVKNDWTGDIAKMLYPSSAPLCGQYYFDIGFSEYRFLKPRSSSMTNDEIMLNLMGDSESMDTEIMTRNNSAEGSAYIFRDSFCRSMLPFFVDNYRSTYITRSPELDLKNMSTRGYTSVIYEIVERKLSAVTDQRPDIFAPECDKVNGTVVPKNKGELPKIEKTSDGMLVYGIIEDSLNDRDNIFIAVKRKGKTRYFEAFPITECKKLSAEKSDKGYSALINISDLDNSEISVIVSEEIK